MKKAVILLSGGLDSATTAAVAKTQGFKLHALSFDYGQRHLLELQAAQKIARQLGIDPHVMMKFDLRAFGGSALTAGMAVPKNQNPSNIASPITPKPTHEKIPVTYVPARNTIFLSFALAYAETLSANDIFIGVNALDYSGYPDCRPEYIEQFQKLARLATKAGVEGQQLTIHTPLIRMTKAEIIRLGAKLGVDLRLTTSCYDPTSEGLACGVCDSCYWRKRGFEQARLPDPTQYISS